MALNRYFTNSDPKQFDAKNFANNNNNNNNKGNAANNAANGAAAAAATPSAQAFASALAASMGLTPQQMVAQQQAYAANANRMYDQSAVAAYDPQSGVRAADRAFHEQMLPSNYDASGASSFQQQRQDSMKLCFAFCFCFCFVYMFICLYVFMISIKYNNGNK